jgi:hypothetical protein
MAHSSGLSQWQAVVSSRMNNLTPSQAATLAAYSYGMVMTGHCGQTIIGDYVAALRQESPANVRQRLREWCYDAVDKRGPQRQDVQTASCFAPLLRWVLAQWHSPHHCLVFVCDATALRQTFTVLSISLVYRACALPLAWVIVPGCQPGDWQTHWLRLLQQLASAVPAGWQVLVLTDRGLYAKWLFLGIQAQGWHPFMRINAQGLFQLSRPARWRRLAHWVRRGDEPRAVPVICFRTARAQLRCTLLSCWSATAATPWLVLTDLPATQSHVMWYRLRSWIEAGFKDLKRGGWHWEPSKMTHPKRAERLWLVMAVATLWVLSVGGEADAQRMACQPPTHAPRALSCFVQGLNRIRVARDQAEPLPLGHFCPDSSLELNLKI